MTIEIREGVQDRGRAAAEPKGQERPRDPSQRSRQEQRIVDEIITIRAEVKNRYGSPRVQGFEVSVANQVWV